MKASILLRWVATKWALEPWKWALLIALMALWPAIQILSPFGGSSTIDDSRALIYEVAFMAAGLGVACALDALEVLPACAYRLGLRPGWPAEGLAMTLAGVVVQGLALTVPLIARQLSGGAIEFDFAARAILNSASIASVGLLLLRIQMPDGSRALVLLALTWILPALVPSACAPEFLDAMLRPTLHDHAARAFVAGQITSICALLLAAHLMDAQRRQRL